jgi:glycosyltransferase involved in cell wall biosynthesis
MNHIVLPGLVENVEKHLSNSHIYLHSAVSEPFGLVIAEAMAASLPVVCLNSGGPKDIIDHEQNGFLLPLTSTPQHFALAVSKLVKEPRLYGQIAVAAHLKVEKLDIRYCVERLLFLYSKVINAKKTSN